ncbi:hypothetical protein V1478_008818 [Vespula squamosa]|uniref:Uncharacterized protein n=1 Tax=Vespula squamosa TaxID=30214 RepID=A0ABD2AV07_VESSQ
MTGRASELVHVAPSRMSRVTVSSWVSRCSNLHVVRPGSVLLAIYRNLNLDRVTQVLPGEWLHILRCFKNLLKKIMTA